MPFIRMKDTGKIEDVPPDQAYELCTQGLADLVEEPRIERAVVVQKAAKAVKAVQKAVSNGRWGR